MEHATDRLPTVCRPPAPLDNVTIAIRQTTFNPELHPVSRKEEEMEDSLNATETSLELTDAYEGDTPPGQQAADKAYPPQGKACGDNLTDALPDNSEGSDNVVMPVFKEKETTDGKTNVFRWYFVKGYNNRKFIMAKLKISPYEFDRLYRILCNRDKKFYEIDLEDEVVRKAKITDTGVTISKRNLELLGADSVFSKGKEVIFKFNKNTGEVIASLYNGVG